MVPGFSLGCPTPAGWWVWQAQSQGLSDSQDTLSGSVQPP